MDTQANGAGSAVFQEALQAWTDNKNYSPLMDIDIAMWPEAVAFANDVSDREQWLIDRWAARCQARFRWPEEVQKLCAEGADLNG
jgi:hypothetical protein